MELLIQNACILTCDDDRPVLRKGCLGVDEGKIVWLSDRLPAEPAKRVLDGTDKILMPGMVNAHAHVSMSLLRGYADDYNLQDWLNQYIFPAEAKLDGEAVYIGALLGMAEMARFGTISLTDMYMKIPFVAKAAIEAGLYANISNAAMSFDPESYCFETDGVTRQMEEALEQWHNTDHGRVRLDAAIHGEYTSFPKLWRDYSDMAKRNGLNMHVHLSETAFEHSECLRRYGRTPAQMLASEGVFDVRTTAAHCVHVSDEDMRLLAEKQVTAVHNPVSNLKLASGVARVTDLLNSGVPVALGTDGVASNNNHDLFEEMKLAAILQKGVTGDPTAVPAWTALKMATRGGAFAQGRENEIGMLRVGYDASLILLDAGSPQLTPVHDPVSAAVYSARGSDVCLTMVRGKVIYENGRYPTIDLERVRWTLKNKVLPRMFGA